MIHGIMFCLRMVSLSAHAFVVGRSDAHLSCFGVNMRASGLVLIIALTDPCLPFSTIFKNDRKGFCLGNENIPLD